MGRPLLLQYFCIGMTTLQRCYPLNQPGWIHQRHRSTIRHTAIIRSLYNTLIYALQKILDLI